MPPLFLAENSGEQDNRGARQAKLVTALNICFRLKQVLTSHQFTHLCLSKSTETRSCGKLSLLASATAWCPPSFVHQPVLMETSKVPKVMGKMKLK